jgi:hypothetical protein
VHVSQCSSKTSCLTGVAGGDDTTAADEPAKFRLASELVLSRAFGTCAMDTGEASWTVGACGTAIKLRKGSRVTSSAMHDAATALMLLRV